MKQSTVSNEEFIEAWQKASSRREAAEQLDMTLQTISARAIRYRQAGIMLKRFRTANPHILDVAKLAKLAEKYGPLCDARNAPVKAQGKSTAPAKGKATKTPSKAKATKTPSKAKAMKVKAKAKSTPKKKAMPKDKPSAIASSDSSAPLPALL